MSVKVRINNREYTLSWDEFEKLILRKAPNACYPLVAMALSRERFGNDGIEREAFIYRALRKSLTANEIFAIWHWISTYLSSAAFSVA